MGADRQGDIDLLLAAWALKRLASEDVPGLAVAALEHGCASDAVATLAGAHEPTRADIEDELPRLLHDLGRDRPSELHALKTLVDDCARRIADGDVDPVVGAEHIWGLWGYDAGSDVRRFIALAIECEDENPGVPRYAADIVEDRASCCVEVGST